MDCGEADYEIIAVFDGFESGALTKLLDSVPSKIIKIKNKVGVATSLNEGIAASQGDFVFRMDADDLWLPGRLNQQIKNFSESDKNIISGVALHINSNSRSIPKILSIPKTVIDRFEPLLLGNFITHPTVAFRGKWIRENPYPESEAEDWAMWLKHMNELAVLNGQESPILAYRRHSGQITRKIRIQSQDEIIEIWIKALQKELRLTIDEKTAQIFFGKKKNLEIKKFEFLLYRELKNMGVNTQLLRKIMSQRGLSIGFAERIEIFPKASTFINFLCARMLS